MLEYFNVNGAQIMDGLLFGLGVLAVYLGAIVSGALIRSLSGAGSTGITFIGRYVRGWWDYLRGDDRNIVNVTLNMIIENHLKFDTVVADRRLWLVWPNAYRVMLIRRAARRTTTDNPVLLFPEPSPPPTALLAKMRRACADRVHGMLTSTNIVENGRRHRVHLLREDDYKATYGPLISLVSEKCNNDNAIDLALGRPMDEHRLVIALTFEKLSNRRARHLRAMIMLEDTLRDLPRNARTWISRSTRPASAPCRRSRGNTRRIPSASASSRSGGRRRWRHSASSALTGRGLPRPPSNHDSASRPRRIEWPLA
jgi:hypothetical protein